MAHELASLAPGTANVDGDSQYAKPYKGLESFGVEDADFFFGRDLESDQIIAKILSSRLMVLHAQSGTGKTSLLNARVIPGLEARGVTAVRTTPSNNPTLQIQTASLLQLLPPPQAECAAIERAWQALGAPETLGEMLREFDRLRKEAPADPRCRSLVAPVEVSVQLPWTEDEVSLKTYPWFCRLLRSAVGMSEFASRLTLIETLGGGRSASARRRIDEHTALSELFEGLSSDVARHTTLLPTLFSNTSSLEEFFGRVYSVQGDTAHSTQLVVLFDQAEELFTRYVDRPSRSSPGPDWRGKWAFFGELERLIGEPQDAIGAVPVRFVISLRSEYYAHLDGLRAAAWADSNSVYHLKLLTKEQATDALRRPALMFDYHYTDDCTRRLVDELAIEERFVEPSHLQIVCEHLWAKKQRQLLSGRHREEAATAPRIFTIIDVDNPRDIVRRYFEAYLATLGRVERLETLEMLEQLVTRSGTRNILNREDLVRAPFRDSKRRDLLLRGLAERRLVREEGRLGGRFVEITHEFLVDFILDAIKELPSDIEHARLRWALDSLAGTAAMVPLAHAAPLLSLSQLLAIHDNRQHVVLNTWLKELMLRSVLALLQDLPENRRDAALKVWVEALVNDPAWEPTCAEALGRIDTEYTTLTLAELRAINREPDAAVSPAQLRAVLRSELASASPAERHEIVRWTTKWMAREN